MTCVCCAVTSWPSTASRGCSAMAWPPVPGLWGWGRASTWPQHRLWDTARVPRSSKGGIPGGSRGGSSSILLLALHSLLSQSLFLQPSACPEAGPVSLSLFNLQLFWKGKFHEPVVFSCLLPSLHTYLPTSLHIDLPTHFSLFPCVVPNGPIHSSLVTV